MEVIFNEDAARMLKLRKRLKLTQREVAVAVGITDQTVSNWENGYRKPQLSPEQYYRLLEVLKCTPAELAGIDDQGTKKNA